MSGTSRRPPGWKQGKGRRLALSRAAGLNAESPRDWTEFLANNCRSVDVVPGRALTLSGADAVWRVTGGTVDVYINLVTDADEIARRDFLFTLGEGGALMGVPASEVIKVVVSGRSGARLEELSLDAYQELMRQGDGEPLERWTSGTDLWLLHLHTALRRFAPPVDFIDAAIAVGESRKLRRGQRLSGAEGLTWIRFDRAAVALLDGAETTALGEPCYLPLSPHVWLTAKSDIELTAVSTDELQRTAHWLPWVHSFNRQALRLLRFHIGGVYKAELERLLAKAEALEIERNEVLARFATVVDGGSQPMRALSPLVAACQRIGEELGVKVRDPAEETTQRPRSTRAHLERISRRSRLRTRPVVLRDGWHRSESVSPLLGFWRDSGHPVALLPGKAGNVRLWDPMAGDVHKNVDEDIAQRIDPGAYIFHRTLPDRPLGFRDLAGFALRFIQRDLFRAAFWGASAALLGLLLPIAMGWIIDVVIPTRQSEQLWRIGAGLAVAAGAVFCFKVAQDIALLRVQGRITATLQPAILDRLLRMPNTFFRDFSAGDLAERANTVDMLQERLAGGSPSVLMAGMFSAVNFGLMFVLDTRMAWTASALILVILLVSLVVVHRQSKAWARYQTLVGEQASMLLQVASGMPRIRLAGAEDRIFVRWGDLAMQIRELLLRCFNREALLTAFLRGFEILALVAVFAVFAFDSGDRLSTGFFLAFIAALTATLTGIVGMSRTLLELSDMGPLYDRIRPILENVPENETDKVQPGMLTGLVEAHELVFSYGDGLPRVLNGISFQIEPGQYLAIVGPSGCGKSTLFRLMLGFEQPSSGSIYYDGKDLAGLDLRSLRHQVGVVLQQDQLIEASILDNIRANEVISLEEAWNAARMSGIADDIEAMPLGMHTVVSARGADLSGGQVQRLLLARAIAARPRILLLDEATSALDNQTQAIVTDSLERLRITRIAIAHRLSTVRKADKILVMDKGQVVETGTYQELMEKQGYFADLVERQIL